MATYQVTLVNEAEGINQTIEVADDQYILEAKLLKIVQQFSSKHLSP